MSTRGRSFGPMFQFRVALATLAAVVVLGGPVALGLALPQADTTTASRVVAPSPDDTEHLSIMARVTGASLLRRGGPPVSLVLDITPKPGMRIYAPGQDTYVPVALTLDPRHDAVRAGTPGLPAPRLFVFPPTGEQTLVFDRPFRLELPVRLVADPARDWWARADLAQPPEADQAVLRTMFAYQACDDLHCYVARRLPLEWRVPFAAGGRPVPKP